MALTLSLHTTTLAELFKTLSPQSIGDIAALLTVAASSALVLYKPWDRPDSYHHVWFEKPQLKNGGGSLRQKKSRDIAAFLEESRKDLVIFWGSQSGTAESFASRLARDCQLRFGLKVIAADLSDYDAKTIASIPASKSVVFIMSTFGEGDPSDNACDFWKYLHAKGDKKPFSTLNYAALGLGNSNYQHYNRVIDVVTSILGELGATAILPTARVDDAEGSSEGQFVQWKQALLNTLKGRMNLEEREPVYIPGLKAGIDDSIDIADLHLGNPVQKRAATSSPLVSLPITTTRELFTSSSRNCLHLELDLSEVSGMSYKTGDHIAVWPVNPDDEVERLLHILGFSNCRTSPVSIKSLDSAIKVHVPAPTTAEALFRNYLEICGPVSSDTIQALVQFAPISSIASFLEQLAKDDAEYSKFSQSNYLTFSRLLGLAAEIDGRNYDGIWQSIPLSFVVETLRPLQPRLYSISSSSTISPKTVSITALVIQTPVPRNPTQSIIGVASTYLYSTSLRASSQVSRPALSDAIMSDPMPRLYVSIRKSNFRPPPSTIDIIMISAGTGVAPFRGFLLERARFHAMSRPVGRTLLFFGCRDHNEDYIYRQEFEHAISNLPKAEIIPVFSRVDYGGKPGRGYVQDAVKARREQLCSMILGQGARVYVCGRAAMSREVALVLKEGVASAKGWNENQRDKWWSSWRRQGGFMEDVWG